MKRILLFLLICAFLVFPLTITAQELWPIVAPKISATPKAGAIPRAGIDGKLNSGWIPTTISGANETYSSGWNADTGVPEKDDIYDYLHLLDTDDDGDIDTVDAARFSSPGAIGDITPEAVYSVLQITSHGATEDVTAATMYGNIHVITGAYIETLPAAVVGMSGTFRASTAAAFSVDSNGADNFEMFDGTVMAAGYKLTSGGTKNEFITIYCESANTWIVIGQNGAFIDGGA